MTSLENSWRLCLLLSQIGEITLAHIQRNAKRQLGPGLRLDSSDSMQCWQERTETTLVVLQAIFYGVTP